MPKKKGQPDLKIEQIEKALLKCNGLVTVAAKMLGVTHSAISHRIRKSPRLQKVQEDIVEKMIDVAENTLHDRMHTEKNLTAAIFYLKTKGRHRGYVERHENELSGNPLKPIVIERVIVDPQETDPTD